MIGELRISDFGKHKDKNRKNKYVINW